MSSKTTVAKRLTFVFDDDSPLSGVEHSALVDGLYLDSLPGHILEQGGDFNVAQIHPHFSQFFRDHLCKTTLTVEFAGSPELNYEGVVSGEATANSKATHWCIAAMLHTPRFLAPCAAFVTIPSQSRICNSHEMLQYGYVAEPGQAAHPNRPLDPDEINAINSLYPAVCRVLKPDANGGLVTAIAYYQQAFHRNVDRNIRFLSMIMGLECLFGNVFGEISHQVSERVACFLEIDGKKRQALYSELKQLYSLRSQIAHGRQKPNDQKKIGEAFPRVVWILRCVLARTLGDQRLIRLFDASPQTLGEAMQHLIFQGPIESWPKLSTLAEA